MKNNSLSKATWDMSRLQLSWAIWFVVIVLIVYIAVWLIGGKMVVSDQLSELTERILTGNWEEKTEPADNFGFISFISHASKIFMLVCGIISVYGFMTFFVKQGVTRKTYFYSATISSLVVSAVIALGAGTVYLLEVIFTGTGEQFAPGWPAAIFIYGLLIFAYFIFGWIIGANFYRSAAHGLTSTVLATALAFLLESLMNQSLMTRLSVPEQWKAVASFAGIVLLLIGALWFVRFTTRNVRIRLK